MARELPRANRDGILSLSAAAAESRTGHTACGLSRPTRPARAWRSEMRPGSPTSFTFREAMALVTEGSVILGEPYTLWARVAGRGGFSLYDYNNLLVRQDDLAAGWYRISGAYADFLGLHIYRFTSSSAGSNNVTLQAEPGSYPTSFSLTGKVVDDKGLGISGVRVVLSNSDGGTFSTVTDASGIYAIDAATGVYLINAELSGYRFTPTTAHVWTGAVSAARPIVGYSATDHPVSGQQNSY